MASMPWKETDSMKERVKFVLEWEKRWNASEGHINFAGFVASSGSAVRWAMSGFDAISRPGTTWTR